MPVRALKFRLVLDNQAAQDLAFRLAGQYLQLRGAVAMHLGTLPSTLWYMTI